MRLKISEIIIITRDDLTVVTFYVYLLNHRAGPGLKKGKVRVFHDLCPEYGAVAVVGLGKPGLGYNEQEEIHEDRESVRIAAAAGCRSLQDVEKTEIWVEGLGNPEAAAEGATLGLWLYQENKKQANQKKMPLVHCLELEILGAVVL
ncbi:bleomycin hydrolase [Homalodisca vitripennis]|nr:bleomycin hydrolase [Homalodisca vitripennis]